MTQKKTLVQRIGANNIAGYCFISPFVIGFLWLTVIPMLSSLYFSFTKYDMIGTPEFIGLKNYIRMFTDDPLVYKTLGVTALYAFVSVPLRLMFALLVAMLLKTNSTANSFYRALVYLPSMVGGSVAVAVLWRRLFANDGVFNAILAMLGLPSDVYWLGSTSTAIWTLILLAVWQFGSPMLIFISGLKQIPVSLYEAATVDGAGKVRIFFKVTLPMLTPVIFFNLIMQLIGSLMAFTQSYIITGGKPMDSTLFYAVYMYRQSLVYYDMGYGCALAWFMVFIISILTFIIFRSSDKWVFYET